MASLTERLDVLIEDARHAAHIRDYIALCTEETLLRLLTDNRPISQKLLEVARAVNPFLGSQRADVERLEAASTSGDDNNLPIPFRPSDTCLIDEPEKDLLVLLWYCDGAVLEGSMEEALAQLLKMAAKYGTIKDLDLRKESLSETEVILTHLRTSSQLTCITDQHSLDLVLLGASDLADHSRRWKPARVWSQARL